jgi:PAP2 superfamily protein
MRNFLYGWTISHAQSTARRYGRVVLVVVLMSAAAAARASAQDATVSIDEVSGILPVDNDATTPPADRDAATPQSGPPAATSLSPPPVSPAPGQNTTPVQNTTPSLPQHTGLTTLVRDTVHDYAWFPRRESTWIILGVGGGLAAALHPLDDDVNARLVSSGSADKIWKAGNIIGGPVIYIAPVALYLGGRYFLPKVSDESQTNKWSHIGLDMIRAELLEEGIVQGLKFTVRRERPDGSNNQSFPSGHAASTFAVAAVVERHLGYRLAIPTLLIATYVGTSRLHDNRHFLSDVVFGAAVGTAAGWTVVGRHGRTNYAIQPTPVPGGYAVMVTRRAASSN